MKLSKSHPDQNVDVRLTLGDLVHPLALAKALWVLSNALYDKFPDLPTVRAEADKQISELMLANPRIKKESLADWLIRIKRCLDIEFPL